MAGGSAGVGIPEDLLVGVVHRGERSVLRRLLCPRARPCADSTLLSAASSAAPWRYAPTSAPVPAGSPSWRRSSARALSKKNRELSQSLFVWWTPLNAGIVSSRGGFQGARIIATTPDPAGRQLPRIEGGASADGREVDRRVHPRDHTRPRSSAAVNLLATRSVDEVAEALGITARHLQHLVLADVGLAPKRYQEVRPNGDIRVTGRARHRTGRR